jgi:hypothetical protein
LHHGVNPNADGAANPKHEQEQNALNEQDTDGILHVRRGIPAQRRAKNIKQKRCQNG